MRPNKEVLLHKHTTIPDEYGGEDTIVTSTSTIEALVSVAGDDLKPLPSGYGYYRVLNALVSTTTAVSVNDVIEVDSVMFIITAITPYNAYHIHLRGYETHV